MQHSIRTRLTAAFLLSAFAPLLIVGAVTGWQSYQAQLQQTIDLERQVALRISTAVTAFVQELETELRIAADVQGLHYLPPERQQVILAALISYEGYFDELTLLNKQGREQLRLSRTRVFAPGDLGDRSQQDEFTLPATSGQTFYSPVRFDEATGEPLMTLAIPLLDLRSGQTQGVLVAEARVKKIWEVIGNIPLSEGENIYILDAHNRVIAHRNPSIVLKGTLFPRPSRDGIQTGLGGTSVVLAANSIQFGDQTFTVVAEKPLLESLALVIRTWLVILAVSVIAALIAARGFMVARDIFRAIEGLSATTQAIEGGDLTRQADATRRDELGALAHAFNSMTAQLRQTLEGLERTVAERTAEAERRAAFLQAAAQVSRAASSILDVEQLMRQMVELICEQFNLYHVGLFLVNESGQWADYRAGSGEAGRGIVKQGLRLEVSDKSMTGWCIAHAQARVAQDVRTETVRVDHPLLAETRSEAALPLIARGRVIGALNAQSDQLNAFGPDVVGVLQTMCDQIAVAMDNARLFAQTQAALEAERRAYGELSRQAWSELLRAHAAAGYHYVGQQVVPLAAAPAPDAGRAELTLPLKTRDHTIGKIGLRKSANSPDWTPEETALAQTLAEQLGVALESARLYQDTQRRAAQEKLVGEVTARMRETLDIDAILQTAIRELGQALGAVEAEVRLKSEDTL